MRRNHNEIFSQNVGISILGTSCLFQILYMSPQNYVSAKQGLIKKCYKNTKAKQIILTVVLKVQKYGNQSLRQHATSIIYDESIKLPLKIH